MKKTALLSVSDKSGIVDFAKQLTALDFQIVSTGGTYRLLEKEGVTPLIAVEDFTGYPEGLEGRIKTLTPQVFGGVLAERHKESHMQFLTENELQTIDMVVVNLYPFRAAYENPENDFAAKVEQIDIGGPSMIRAAAKNYAYCAPVVDPEDYKTIIIELKTEGNITPETRKKLANKTFAMTAHYDLLIAKFWEESAPINPLRYGENPHQTGAAVANPFDRGASLFNAEMLQGKPLSYNNYADASAALDLALSFPTETPFATILKHAQPCGAAMGETLETAFEAALECDPVSAFGGIMAVNGTITKALAERMVSFFNEIVLAPEYDAGALEVFAKKPNMRVLRITDWDNAPFYTSKTVRGGTILQDADTTEPDAEALKVVTKKQPTDAEMQDMIAAWRMVKVVRSNAIVAVKNGAMVGKGGGQTSRVDAMNITLAQAGEKAQGGVIASDAFFPFPDNIELAKAAGITAIIQPGGSIKDETVIAAADEAGIAMVFTGMRAFLH